MQIIMYHFSLLNLYLRDSFEAVYCRLLETTATWHSRANPCAQIKQTWVHSAFHSMQSFFTIDFKCVTIVTLKCAGLMITLLAFAMTIEWNAILERKANEKSSLKTWNGGLFFYPPLGIFMSMSSVVIQALPCFRAFLLLYKNIIRYRASMVNSAGWKSRVALPPTDRRHVKRRLAEPFGYSVTCALIGPWFLSVIFFYRPLIMQHGRKY